MWLRSSEIFLNQMEYPVMTLSRFGMMGITSMDTPLVIDLEKLDDFASDSSLVDSTMYRKWIGSLMVFL